MNQASGKGKLNIHAVPRVTSVVVSVGVGKNRDDKVFLEAVQKDLKAITGQMPHECRAKKAVAGFNVRQGNLVAYRVTLRGQRMNDFVRRLVHLTLPRVRDFRGVGVSSFDGHGNLNYGLKEQLAFPEIHPEKTDAVFGVQVNIITSAPDDKSGIKLLRELNFPLAEASELD
ncbi:MAG: 50S ribosomal protein L5 [bacterium]